MPRPERSIDPSEGPVQQFAADLRKLREEAGGPTYRALAALTFFSKATLSAAASGNRMPSWAVTAAYVAACGGDVGEWRYYYEATHNKLDLPVKAAPRRPVEPGACVCPPETRCATGLTAPVRFDGPAEPVADNADPKRAGCAFDPGVSTLDRVEINTPAGNFLGNAELRYSPRFQAAWGRFTPSKRMDYIKNALITITAKRPATHTIGTPFTTMYDGQAAYGNILLSRQGCVEIVIAVTAPSGSGSATTRCHPT